MTSTKMVPQFTTNTKVENKSPIPNYLCRLSYNHSSISLFVKKIYMFNNQKISNFYLHLKNINKKDSLSS